MIIIGVSSIPNYIVTIVITPWYMLLLNPSKGCSLSIVYLLQGMTLKKPINGTNWVFKVCSTLNDLTF